MNQAIVSALFYDSEGGTTVFGISNAWEAR